MHASRTAGWQGKPCLTSPSAAGSRAAVERLERRAYLTIAFTGGVQTPVPGLPAEGGAYQRPLIGDFDNDGLPDAVLAVTSPFQGGPPGYLYFLKNNGGTFAAPGAPTRAIFNNEPAVGDFNGDGTLDLALADTGADKVHVLVGVGDGTFAAAQDFAAGDGPFAMRAADFNNDGLSDVATGDGLGNTLTVRLGDATAVLAAPVTFPSGGTSPFTVVAGDFNGDGNADLVAGNDANNVIAVFPGNGDGTFGPAAPTAGRATVVDVGDFNNDGKLDLLRGVDAATVPLVLLGNGDLTFQPAADPTATNLAAAADLDGDGNLDVLGGGVGTGGQFEAAAGNGDGTFAAPLAYGLVAAGASVGGVGTAGDITNDGLPDVAYVTTADGQARAFTIAQSTPPQPGPNLVPSAAGAVPPAVVGGSAGKLAVRVTNAGVETFSGPVTVRLVASADGAVDGADAEVATRTVKLSLKPGRAKSVKFKFTYPAGLPDGSYSLLAQVDPDGSASQTPKTDDVAPAGQVTIAAPFVDLAAAFPSPLAAEYRVGRKAKVAVRLGNLGNVLAKGTATLTLTSSADDVSDAGDAVVGTATVKVKLKPAAGKAYKVSFTLPPGFPAGSTRLFATVASTDLTDAASLNNSVLATEAFVVVG